jgi:hypothetical protein
MARRLPELAGDLTRRCTSLSAGSDVADLLYGQRSSAMEGGVLVVFTSSDVSKVLGAVISGVAVQVRNIHPGRALAYESQRNQNVHRTLSTAT